MYPLHRKVDLVIQEVDDETLVYDLKTHRARCLNETASQVWKLCDGVLSNEEIARVLSARTGVVVPVEVVDLAVCQLADQELLEGPDPAVLQKKSTRRELLKKVGLTAAIAIPAISVITAPLAVQAQSLACVPEARGCTCNQINSGRKGLPCTPSSPCSTNCRCIHANNGNNNTGDCVV